MRSLLVEIHPPELGADGLAAALEDLTAPAADLGLETSVSVTGVDGVPDEIIALVWRVAQEAVRNATRHAHASRLDVRVAGSAGAVTLEVVDDGRGFDRAEPAPHRRHFGLRGLASLVADAGGRLDVTTAPGEGTTVRLDVGTR